MKLLKKWKKAKEQLARAKDHEGTLRQQLGDVAVRPGDKSATIDDGDFKIAIAKKTGYSVPSGSIIRLKNKLGSDTFSELFRPTYGIREGVYNQLGPKQKKIVDKLIKVYNAPYQVTRTEK